MKKFIYMLIVFALIFTSCTPDDTSINITTFTTLKIKNESSYNVTDIRWNGIFFTEDSNSFIGPGNSIQKTVPHGSGYLHLVIVSMEIGQSTILRSACRTQSPITVTEGEQGEFVILNNTIVINENNINSTVEDAAPKRTSLTIKNESSHVISTLRWNGQLFVVQPSVLLSGSNIVESTLQEGNGNITFAFYYPDTGFADMGIYNYGFRTQNTLVVEKGKSIEFIFTNNTPLEDEDGNLDTLNNFANRVATLTIRNDTAYRLNGITWNNSNYTTAPNGSYLEPATVAHRRWSNLHFSGANLPIKIRIGAYDYITAETVSVGKWDKEEFVFNNSTVLIDNDNNKKTLYELISTLN